MPSSRIGALVIFSALLVMQSFARAEDPVTIARLEPGERGQVHIDGAFWQALRSTATTADPTLPGPTAHVRQVELEPAADALRVRVTWLLDAFEPGWFDGVLAGPELRDLRVTWDDGPAAWDSGPQGARLTGYVDGPTRIELTGELPGDPASRTSYLRLLPALRGDATVLLPEGTDPTLAGTTVIQTGPRTWWTGGPDLQLTLAPTAPPRERTTLAVGVVGLGLTIADTVLRGRARLRWTLRRGQLDRLSFRATGLGEDLQITGGTVRAVTRSGDRFMVELQAAADTSVEVDLTWTSPLPEGSEGSVQLPSVVLDGTSRTDTSLQLARDGEWEALPELDGWNPRAGSLLPDWGRALVEGTPTAAFLTPSPGRAGSISLLRFEPVSGPPIVVDVADHEVAATAEGRLLTRVRYEVVNDRGAYLELLPPFGSSFLTVRVDEEPVVPVRAGGAWRIPLPRSLETVSGLISVPVEVVLLADGEPWGRRETRELTLPQVSAPIAASRVTLYLPPGYEELRRNDDSRRVEAFSEGEGISWGFLAEDKDARDLAERADLVFKYATEAWLGNEFDEAQKQLDLLAHMGASNLKTDQLQSNLDVVFEPEEPVLHGEGGGYGSAGGDDGLESANLHYDKPADGKSGRRSSSTRSSGEEALRRRIRDQARARGEDEYREYESTRRDAERALQEGDYKAAEEQFRRAREVGSKLQYYEQEESEEISQLNAEIDRQLAEVTVKAEEKERRLVKVIQEPRKKKAVKRPAPARASVSFEGVGASGSGIGFGSAGGSASGASVGGAGKGGLTASGHGVGGGGGASTGLPKVPEIADRTTEFDFEDDWIEGELLLPGDAVADMPDSLPDLRDGRYTIDLDASVATDEDGDSGIRGPRPAPDPAPRSEEAFGPMGREAHPLSTPAPVTTASSGATGVSSGATAIPRSQTLTVTAATRSVPIPRIGQSLRYQQLLLPAGVAPAIVVRARLPRSEGTRP